VHRHSVRKEEHLLIYFEESTSQKRLFFISYDALCFELAENLLKYCIR